MTTHTDRIRQMAIESGLIAFVDRDGALVTERDDQTAPILRFAQLVAEDCAMAVDAAMDQEDVCTKDAPSGAIRARYSLKD